jgi:serine/threonine protein kinase
VFALICLFAVSMMIHPNIVQLKGMCMHPFCMVLEFCEQGNLYDYIHNKDKCLNWAMTLKFARDIANGMNFVQSLKLPLIHRNLKSPNILVHDFPLFQ